MKLQVSLVTDEFRGDHYADVTYAIDCDENMSIIDLAHKLLRQEKSTDEYLYSARIEIRVCRVFTLPAQNK